MKIQLISSHFYPDELAGSSLFTDLVLYLAEKGHDVRVITTFSYYPAWKLRPEDVGVPLRDETFRGIPVRRIRMYVPEKPDGKGRILSDFSFLWGLVRHAPLKGWTPDVVITFSPMFSQCLSQRFLYLGKGIPRLIVVQDFVVDAALDLGILNLPLVPRALYWARALVFSIGGYIDDDQPDDAGKIAGQTAGHAPLRTGSELDSCQPGGGNQTPKRPAVDREPATLFYAGNLGVKQGLPTFIQTFKQSQTGWQLNVHGGGAELPLLREEIAGRDDIKLGGVLEEADYVLALRTATACLVTQRAGVGANFLPSKLLPALAAGTPVLAACDASSPLGLEVSEGGIGEVIDPSDPEALRKTLSRWKADPGILKKYSANALARSQAYRREAILPRYESELASLVAKRGSASSASV